MCNRYIPPDQAEIERIWHIGRNKPFSWPKEIFPRSQGPFVRAENGQRTLVVGQWGLIPDFAKSPNMKYSTNNARSEELSQKVSYRGPWANHQRCVIPAMSFDEPCWETGKNQWWRFRRSDGQPWGLAGLWNTWVDRNSGEIQESYTILTLNADHHPLMKRMHKPDPAYPPDEQDKRSVVALEIEDLDQWLFGTSEAAARLIKLTDPSYFEAGPKE